MKSGGSNSVKYVDGGYYERSTENLIVCVDKKKNLIMDNLSKGRDNNNDSESYLSRGKRYYAFFFTDKKCIRFVVGEE